MKKASKQSQLTILNPQPFEVIAILQPRRTGLLESKKLAPKVGKWVVNSPGPGGTWIAFHRASNNEYLAGTLLTEGATFAELFWDTEISFILKQNPEEKLMLANGLDIPVIVSYELQREIAISTNHLPPDDQKGSSIIAEQQPTRGVDLWVKFTTENGSLLTTFVASYELSYAAVTGKAHYYIATTPL